MLLLLLAAACALYFLWDFLDYQRRVKTLRKRLGIDKKPEPLKQIIYALPLVFVVMLFQLPLGVGILCLLFLLYYYDKQYQQANLIKAIEDELPQFLRLMAVTIRGGLSTNTALEEIVKRMPIGPLTNELSQVVQEMDLGLSRREALENWAERVKSEQVAFLVQSWMQSEELGTEPSEVLNFLADQLYDRKFRSVEAEAMKAGVKITIPLAFLIFPAVMIIIFGPILLGGL
ncbi:MAG: type II secretion system F family protein [Bacillota bacterium]|jgi:tight adherence protein C|nr:type II secretion system F family protein [Bacillota bacterium]NLU53993.1 type II secretion system F family protein [Bacillota bacterium]HOA90891.1 type II secretion system F family protein [Bacillota bacterium]HOP53093.1 type II secretion system F family protein [Bacillota bacterium]HPT60241.1 type II secretion system F family protein [Bacillota bacterium]